MLQLFEIDDTSLFTCLQNRPQTRNFIIKKETLAQVFSYEFCESFKKPFLQNTSVRQLLLAQPLWADLSYPNFNEFFEFF